MTDRKPPSKETQDTDSLDSPTRVEIVLEREESDEGATGGERSDDAQGDASSDEATAEAKIADLERELAELRDRSMRTLADFDNYRKRVERERAELKRFALAEPLRGLLGVVDNLERALSSGGSYEDLRQGVEMILQQVRELLRDHGVAKIPAAGEPFDPKVHDAVSKEVDAEIETPTVVEELQPGYFLHERLLRPALVKVALPQETDAGAAEGGGGEEADEATGVEPVGGEEGDSPDGRTPA